MSQVKYGVPAEKVFVRSMWTPECLALQVHRDHRIQGHPFAANKTEAKGPAVDPLAC